MLDQGVYTCTITIYKKNLQKKSKLSTPHPQFVSYMHTLSPWNHHSKSFNNLAVRLSGLKSTFKKSHN